MRFKVFAILPVCCALMLTGVGRSQDPAPAHSPTDDRPVEDAAVASAEAGPSLGARYAFWGGVGFFAAGGFSAYLRRRPSAFTLVALWYYMAYHILAAWLTGLAIGPPLLAMLISLVLGPVSKAAAEEGVQRGRYRESPHQFRGTGTLTWAFSLITLGLIASMFAGWSAWDVIPALEDATFARKATISTMLLTGVPVMMWIDTLAHGGLRSLATVPVMARWFLRCRRGQSLLAVLVFCLCFWHSTDAIIPQPLKWEMSFSLTLSIGLLWLLPPYVLLLGESSVQTGRTLIQVTTAAFPFRVVALLDASRIGGIPKPLRTDDLRTASDVEWRQLVDQLITCVPYILLDARTDRPVVVQEASLLLQRPERFRRSTFVISPEGDAEALRLNGVSTSLPGLRTIRADQIETWFEFGALSETGPESTATRTDNDSAASRTGTVPSADDRSRAAAVPSRLGRGHEQIYQSIADAHFKTVAKVIGGKPCELHLDGCEPQGLNVVLVYHWKDSLTGTEADRLDTRTRAFFNQHVADAALAADLAVQPGPSDMSLASVPIPGWYIGGRQQPTFVVESFFDPQSRRVMLTIGPPLISTSTLDGDAIAALLSVQLRALYPQITV